MTRPRLRGCAGALIALGVALAVMAYPRTVADRPVGHGVEGWLARTSHPEPPRPPERPKAKPKRIDAAFRPVPIASLDRVLERKMPDADPEDRLRMAEAILDEARHAAVDPFFVVALIEVESGFDQDAESHAGARGLMQLLPSTLESEVQRSDIDGDLDDPVTHVRAGIRYYQRLLKAFGSHDMALMAYNAGPNRILKYLKENTPIPASIQAYARRVGAEFGRMRPQRKAKAERVDPPAAGGRVIADANANGPIAATSAAAAAPQ